MGCAPKAADEPELKDAVATFAGNQLAAEWAGRVPAGTVVDEGARRAMLLNAQLYTALLHDTPRLALVRNAPVVASTRRILLRTSTIDLELADIISSVDTSYNIDLGTAIGRTPTHLQQTGPDAHHIVRGAFTHAIENPTQERVARDQLEKLGPIHRSARDSNASVAATGSRALDAQPIVALRAQLRLN